jgi:hypothetical protein
MENLDSGMRKLGIALRRERRGKESLHKGGAHGQWQMADGRWQMANGKWQMANGKWQMANGKQPVRNFGRSVYRSYKGLV